MVFCKDVLEIDPETETNRISQFIRSEIRKEKRDGIVVGLSGGIDSAVACALCVNALGKDAVFGLILPEKESNPVSKRYALDLSKELGIDHEVVDITPVLEAFGTYSKRDGVVRKIYQQYDPSKNGLRITLPHDILESGSYNIFRITVEENGNEVHNERLKKDHLNGIIAATNSKQRTRMMKLYYHAERMSRSVCGTTNRPEFLQGFFVKYGDGGADIEPLAHLYKCQVLKLAEHLGVPEEIIKRTPSPDTFGSNLGDEDFFFRMPYEKVDYLLYAWENEIPIDEVCRVMGLEEDQIRNVYRDFESKYKATQNLRRLPNSLL